MIVHRREPADAHRKKNGECQSQLRSGNRSRPNDQAGLRPWISDLSAWLTDSSVRNAARTSGVSKARFVLAPRSSGKENHLTM